MSYLHGRIYVVRVKNGVSECNVIKSGVPQGSVLGPVLFNAYVAPLTKILVQHDIQHHLYADDTQLYVELPPAAHAGAVVRLEEWRCH